MLELFKLNNTYTFPAIDFALDEPNGLLAFGGDLSPKRLIEAYKHGVFPWFNEGEPILWWSPTPRAIIYADKFTANKSLRKSIRKNQYTTTLNNDFINVIKHCANVYRGKRVQIDETGEIAQSQSESNNSETWITSDMMSAYNQLHELGYAHSVEVYDANKELVGGLYGVVVGSIFCGESMFHLRTDASKVALFALTQHMQKHNMNIIDCQLINDHLSRLGCVAISRDEFKHLLNRNQAHINCWQAQELEL